MFAGTCLEEFTARYHPNTNGKRGLNEVYLKDCQSLEVVFDLQDFGHPYSIVALPVLDELKIFRLPKLVDVWKTSTTSRVKFQGFHNLQSIEIEGCNNLRNLFPTYVAKLLQNLKELRIKKCGAMENIVADEPPIHNNHDGEGTSAGIHCLFPRLEVLSLIFLPKLRSLCPQGFTFVATCLEEFTGHYPPNTEQHYGSTRARARAIDVPPLIGKCGLNEVCLKDSQSLEVVFDLQDFGHSYSIVALPVLDELKIIHLPKLIDVWKIKTTSPVSFQGFQNLQSIEVKGCNGLRNLFPTYVAKLLQNLKGLTIKECRAMENIVPDEPKLHYHDGEGTSSDIHCLFPRLKILSLSLLPKLRSLCPQGFTLAGPCLEEYKVMCCPNIEQHYYGNAKKVKIVPNSTNIRLLNGKFILLPHEDILVEGMDQDTWYKDVEVQRYLHNARVICFLSCEKLLSIASSNLMGRLHSLKAMLVGWCDSMEAMFDFKGFDHEELSVSLLIELHLMFLPKLIHIWKIAPQQSHYCFSQLRALKVENCDSLRYIFTISMAKALVKLSSLVIKRCDNVEKIVATCEGEREDKKPRQFFSTNFLVKLKYLPNLICFGPEEDCSKFLTAENLDITVICCHKYRGKPKIYFLTMKTHVIYR
ncbi:hypothetical protein NMG60_11033553 [Bertholletia excelsa]